LNSRRSRSTSPEKRPFFLEGAELVAPRLGFAARLHEAHRPKPPICLSCARPRSSREQLVDLPEPSTIYGASKLTGRLSEKVSIGTLSALVGENTVKVQGPNGDRTKRVVEPLTAYNVLRLKRDIGDNAHVGLLMTSVTRAEDTSAYVPSLDTPGRFVCPNQTSTVGFGEAASTMRTTAGLDARIRKGEWVTSGQLVATAIERGPRARWSTARWSAAATSPRRRFYFGKEGRQARHDLDVVRQRRRKVDFNDLGFMWRQNVRYRRRRHGVQELDPGPTLETHHGFEVSADRQPLGPQRSAATPTRTRSWKFSSFWEGRFLVALTRGGSTIARSATAPARARPPAVGGAGAFLRPAR